MKFLWVFFCLILVGCGSNLDRPKKLYIRNFVSVDPVVEEITASAVEDINSRAGSSIIDWGQGKKPVTIRSISPEKIEEEVFAHARYLEYHCLVEVRTDLEDMMRSFINPYNPNLVSDADWKREAQKIILHELGHCAGFGHVDDPNDLMNPTYNPNWGASVLNKFAQALKRATE